MVESNRFSTKDHWLRLVVLIAVLVRIGSSVVIGERKPRMLTADQERALELLGRISEMLPDISNQEFKIRMQAETADLLWKYDEEGARHRLEEAYRSIESIQLPMAPDEKALASRIPLRHLRAEVLGLVSKRDPDFAESLIAPVVEPATTDLVDQLTPSDSDQAFFLLRMAHSLTETNPQRAAKLINNSLSHGINGWLTPAFQAIQSKHPALADEIFTNALSVAQSDSQHLDKKLFILAACLFSDPNSHMALSFDGGEGDQVSVGLIFGPSRASPALTEQFLDFALDRLMQTPVPTDPVTPENVPLIMQAFEGFEQAHMLLPMFEHYLPDKAVILRLRLKAINEFFRTESGQSLESLMSMFSNNLEDVLNKAEMRKEPDVKEGLYQEALEVASRTKQLGRVSSAIESIPDPKLKSSLRSSLASRLVMQSMKQDDPETAYRYLKDVSSADEQTRLLLTIAKGLVDKKEHALAIERLLEAEGQALKIENRSNDIYLLLLLNVADTMVGLDAVRGLNILRSVVKEMNQYTEGSSRTAQAEVRRSTGQLNQPGHLVHPSNLVRSRAFSVLAREDFGVTLSLAQSIVPAELSLAAQVAVCRGVLEDHSQDSK